MFKCQGCNKLSKRGEGAVRVVTETRYKEYPRREHALRVQNGRFMRWLADEGGVGQETVSEAVMHDKCAREFERRNEPEVVNA